MKFLFKKKKKKLLKSHFSLFYFFLSFVFNFVSDMSKEMLSNFFENSISPLFFINKK